MKPQTKYLMLFSEGLMSFIFALTTPFVQLHFIKLVSPVIYTISSLLTTVLCAFTQTMLRTKKHRTAFRKYLLIVMIVDVILTTVISYLSLDNANLRFLGFTVINSVSVVIWVTIMMEIVNDALSKDKLTDFQVLRQSCGSWATACGGGLAVVLSCLHVEWIITAVTLQCLGTCVFAVCDYKAYLQLTKTT